LRIAELSARTGVAIPTIKYYLREGLLEPGAARAANQADYSERHVQRLRLVRALVDVGGVPIAAARDVVAALGRTDLPPHDLLGVAHEAVAPARHPDRSSADWQRARAEAEDLADRRGWRVNPDSHGMNMLADVLMALSTLEVPELLADLDVYADTAQRLATIEVNHVIARGDPTRMLELVVLGTVLGESLFAALRLLAHEHASAERLTPETRPQPATEQPRISRGPARS
jgi:DNA-binding transcriptional MerR regulator